MSKKEPKIKADKARKPKKAEIIPHLKKKVINTSLNRRIVFYPHPRYWKMHIANCVQHLSYRSEFTNEIIKKYYDSMSIQEQERLLKYFSEMTSDQISYTRKIDNLK